MTNFAVDLSGKVALVTGAGAGIGRAVALTLARAGAAVCVNDVNPDHAERTVEMIQAAGGRTMSYVGDTSKRFNVSAMIEALRDELGGLHILINALQVDRRAEFLDVDEYDWRRVVDMNLGGAFNSMQLAARVMTAEGGGHVVNVLSPAALNAHTDGVAYAASQSGMVGLTREAARALGPMGVRVNAVVVDEKAFSDMAPRAADGHQLDLAEQAARVVLFLCSDGADLIAGQVILATRT